MGLLAGVEAGGTKFVCALARTPGELLARTQVKTTTPAETLEAVASFLLSEAAGERFDGIGVASFGPIDAERGVITDTPKPGWDGADVVSPLREALQAPALMDTDVGGAALGEARYGAGRDLHNFVYLTVGTGIGGGAYVDGRLLHGLGHPEMGHMRIPHDAVEDPFAGVCPYHGDCWEGLASGPAIGERWGHPARDLADKQEVWDLEARYLALGIANITLVLSPERVVIGGGVMKNGSLLPLVREQLAVVLAGYVPKVVDGLGVSEYLVPPALGDDSGVIGALVLAEQAARG